MDAILMRGGVPGLEPNRDWDSERNSPTWSTAYQAIPVTAVSVFSL